EDDDIFANMWISDQQFTQVEDDEILLYLQCPKINQKYNDTLPTYEEVTNEDR
ncbi:19692_t:CDS:2, partial [Funneliformis geosporum]